MIILASFSCKDEQPGYLGETTNIDGAQEQLLRANSNQNHYLLRQQIRISIFNGSDSIIYIPTCARQISYYLQSRVKGQWGDDGANGIPCVGFNAYGKITIAPGRSYTYTDAIIHYGIYRFRYPVTMGSSNSVTWLYTNEFTVDGQ